MFLLLLDQSDIPCITTVIFDLDDYHWQINGSQTSITANHIKFKLKTSK